MAVNDVLRAHRVQQLLAASTSYLNQQTHGPDHHQTQAQTRIARGQGPGQGTRLSQRQARFFGGAFTEAYEQGYVDANDVDNSELVYNDDDDNDDVNDEGDYNDMDVYGDGGDDEPSSFLFEGDLLYPPPSPPFFHLTLTLPANGNFP